MTFYRKRDLWVGLFCVGVSLLLAILHPYSRQWAFGPKIHGHPLCAWQEEYRQNTMRNDIDNGFVNRVREFLGINPPARGEIKLLANKVSDDEARLILLGLVDDPDERVRCDVAYDLGDVECGPSGLHNGWRRVKVVWRDAWMLDSDSRKPVVAALIRLIDDPSAKVRLEAVDSLGWIGPDASEALSKLQKLADEGDSSIKFSAAEALWFISMGAARGPLARHGKH